MAVQAEEGTRYWLSYDLGLRGNYESLYEWLDLQSAEECGESVATFRSRKTIEEIHDELLELIGEARKHRLYLIDSSGGAGKFILGSRKAAPWTGYAPKLIDSFLDS